MNKKPQYVRCIYSWSGSIKSSIKGKIYKTEGKPDFSHMTWDRIYDERPSNPEEYFETATEEDWNKQEGIPAKPQEFNSYLIY